MKTNQAALFTHLSKSYGLPLSRVKLQWISKSDHLFFKLLCLQDHANYNTLPKIWHQDIWKSSLYVRCCNAVVVRARTVQAAGWWGWLDGSYTGLSLQRQGLHLMLSNSALLTTSITAEKSYYVSQQALFWKSNTFLPTGTLSPSPEGASLFPG